MRCLHPGSEQPYDRVSRLGLSGQPPADRVSDAVEMLNRGGWGTCCGRIVLVLAAGADVARRGRVERARGIPVPVLLAQARTKSPTQGGIDEPENNVRQDIAFEDP